MSNADKQALAPAEVLNDLSDIHCAMSRAWAVADAMHQLCIDPIYDESEHTGEQGKYNHDLVTNLFCALTDQLFDLKGEIRKMNEKYDGLYAKGEAA